VLYNTSRDLTGRPHAASMTRRLGVWKRSGTGNALAMGPLWRGFIADEEAGGCPWRRFDRGRGMLHAWNRPLL